MDHQLAYQDCAPLDRARFDAAVALAESARGAGTIEAFAYLRGVLAVHAGTESGLGGATLSIEPRQDGDPPHFRLAASGAVWTFPIRDEQSPGWRPAYFIRGWMDGDAFGVAKPEIAAFAHSDDFPHGRFDVVDGGVVRARMGNREFAEQFLNGLWQTI